MVCVWVRACACTGTSATCVLGWICHHSQGFWNELNKWEKIADKLHWSQLMRSLECNDKHLVNFLLTFQEEGMTLFIFFSGFHGHDNLKKKQWTRIMTKFSVGMLMSPMKMKRHWKHSGGLCCCSCASSVISVHPHDMKHIQPTSLHPPKAQLAVSQIRKHASLNIPQKIFSQPYRVKCQSPHYTV